MVDRDGLKRVFNYDPQTGIFTRRIDSGRHGRWKAGTPAGCKNSLGYTVVRIGPTLYAAHRLAFLYVFGEWPAVGIDHKDGNKSNNKIDNLRLATQAENLQNRRAAQRNSSSGILGVYWSKRKLRWIASLKSGDDRHHSSHLTAEAAASAYEGAKRELHPFVGM